ncbi:MAG: ABC transporter ATP-binding protein [Candidatus Ratteibacteria bacterium]|nr:ABC transporter ATP-binding protein [Candidatus Ratteibacteria bacterium]
MNRILIKTVGLHKSYVSGEKELEVIKGIDLEILDGESIALLGESGAGKSTLLCLLAGLEKPSKGRIFWQGQDIIELSDEQRADLRKRGMGFVFQFFNLIPELSALENIMLPGLIDRKPLQEIAEKAKVILKELKLTQRASHYPYALSGGEQQRVAVGRAIINEPLILFADEPTGNLDKTTAKKILELMLDLMHKRTGVLFIATHQEEIALKMDRIIRIVDGKIVDHEPSRRHVGTVHG